MSVALQGPLAPAEPAADPPRFAQRITHPSPMLAAGALPNLTAPMPHDTDTTSTAPLSPEAVTDPYGTTRRYNAGAGARATRLDLVLTADAHDELDEYAARLARTAAAANAEDDVMLFGALLDLLADHVADGVVEGDVQRRAKSVARALVVAVEQQCGVMNGAAPVADVAARYPESGAENDAASRQEKGPC